MEPNLSLSFFFIFLSLATKPPRSYFDTICRDCTNKNSVMHATTRMYCIDTETSVWQPSNTGNSPCFGTTCTTWEGRSLASCDALRMPASWSSILSDQSNMASRSDVFYSPKAPSKLQFLPSPMWTPSMVKACSRRASWALHMQLLNATATAPFWH